MSTGVMSMERDSLGRRKRPSLYNQNLSLLLSRAQVAYIDELRRVYKIETGRSVGRGEIMRELMFGPEETRIEVDIDATHRAEGDHR